jgi:hypothetical protein
MSQLDLVLINPSSRAQVYQALGTDLAAVENPVWAGLMANFARARGLSVQIIDAEAECLSASEVADRVAHLKPVLAAVVAYGHQPSASTQIMGAVGRACSAVKVACPEQPMLLLGGHVAALPERTLREEEADFVAAGEGVHTLVGLVEALKSPVPDFGAVPGLYLRDGPRVRRGPNRRYSRSSTPSCPGSRGTCCRCPATGRTTGTASAGTTASLTRPSTPPSGARTSARSAASRRRSRTAKSPRWAKSRRRTATGSGASSTCCRRSTRW